VPESSKSLDQNKAYLIVNADDYGCFSSVSRGILDGARERAITATGVMANSPNLDKLLDWTAEVEPLDYGVHLNLSYGEPLTDRMKSQLARWGGRFQAKFRTLAAVVSRRIALDAVKDEWRAQIDRCVDRGLQPRFLNSHEHVHMLPPLFGVAEQLAADFGIRHVRYVRPEWYSHADLQGWFRNLALGAMTAACSARFGRYGTIRFLGIGVSGKLNIDYFRTALPRLEQGKIYELMCHPGYFDPDEIRDPSLLGYHAWEQELSALRSPDFRELCRNHGVQVVGYRDLLM
jgi:predicted glycoside hydrolase/deacetylase ChbG (UPF0249 family)